LIPTVVVMATKRPRERSGRARRGFIRPPDACAGSAGACGHTTAGPWRSRTGPRSTSSS
jgi:hypothetical protein